MLLESYNAGCLLTRVISSSICAVFMLMVFIVRDLFKARVTAQAGGKYLVVGRRDNHARVVDRPREIRIDKLRTRKVVSTIDTFGVGSG